MKTKLLLVALIALVTTIVAQASVSPAVGSAAPDFSVTDANGKTHSLSEYKGKYVVLEWFNAGCPFVRKHYESGNMQKLQQEFTGKNVAWLTIDSSAPGEQGSLTAEEAAKTMAAWKMHSTALLLDAHGKVAKAYGAKNTPHMFVINPEGQLVYEGAIDNKPSTDQADIATASNYVKAALDESMTGKPVSTPASRPYGCSIKYE